MKVEVKCPVCNSVNTHEQFHQMEDLTFKVTKEKFDLYACDDCDAKFQYPFIPEEEVGKYYPGEDYHPFNVNHTLISPSKKRNPQSNYIALLMERHSKDDTFSLIDVGCGGGSFLNSVKHYFPKARIFGVDVSEIAISNLKKIGIDGEAGSLYDLKADHPFDYIVSSQVLEHLNRPHDFIAKISSIAHENSIIMIDVPATDSYSARKYGRSWVHWDLPRHSILYSKKSLSMLFSNYFETIKLQHAGSVVAVRSSKKISQGKNIYTVTMADKLVNYLSPLLRKFDFLYSDKLYWIGKLKK